MMLSMDGESIPTLEYIAAVNVTSLVMSRYDIRTSLSSCRSSFGSESFTEDWTVIEQEIEKEIEKLWLPKHLKQNLSHLVRPIGLEILRWKEFHKGMYYLNLSIPKRFCWTVYGTINKQKTAELLIQDETVNVIMRFQLASLYCLETDIKAIWSQFLDIDKRVVNLIGSKSVPRHTLLYFWNCVMEGNVDTVFRKNGSSPCQEAFKAALRCCNQPAAEYFLQKLTPAQRKESLEECSLSHICYCNSNFFTEELYTDMVYFLLTQVNEEQQTRLIRHNNCAILHCFLLWPYQPLFLKFASQLWHLPPSVFKMFLFKIVRKMKWGFKDFDYQKLFMELWQQSPKSYKEYVFADKVSLVLLYVLYDLGCTESVALVFEHAAIKEQETMIAQYKHMSSDNEVYCAFIQFLERVHKKKRSLEDSHANPSKKMRLEVGRKKY